MHTLVYTHLYTHTCIHTYTFQLIRRRGGGNMDRAQKLDMLKVMTDETDLNVLSVYLDLAAREVCRAAYPFDDSVTTVPDKYAMDHLRVAEYLYAKRKTAGVPAVNFLIHNP